MSALPLAVYDPDGTTPEPIAATFETFFQTTFMPTIGDQKDLTIQKYRDTAQHWQNAVGDVAPARIDQSHADVFLSYLRRRPGRSGNERASDYTVKHHLDRMWRILRLMVKRKVLAELPERPRQRIDQEKFIPKHWMDEQQLETLLSFCHLKQVPYGMSQTDRVSWWQALLYTVWWTAARIRQVLSLRWDDLDGDVLTIRPTQKRAKHRRYVVLNRRGVELLEKIERTDDLIFAGLGPYTNLARHFTRLCASAGIELPPGNAWHSLRRGRCAAEFAAHGIEWAQRQLGHADRATTEESYLNEMVRRQVSIDSQRAVLTSDDFEPADVPAKRPAKSAAEKKFNNRVQKHLHYARELYCAELYDEAAGRCRRAVEAWVGRWVRRRRLHVQPGATLMDRVLLLRQFNIIDTEAVRLLRYATPKMNRAMHDNKTVSARSAGEILMQVSKVCASDGSEEFVEDEAAACMLLDLDELDPDKLDAMERDYRRANVDDSQRLQDAEAFNAWRDGLADF